MIDILAIIGGTAIVYALLWLYTKWLVSVENRLDSLTKSVNELKDRQK